MTPATWPCPTADGGRTDEYALAFDRDRARRLLIVPALFEEANRLRRLTVEIMRRLDAAGIDSILPDLPGCNESLQLCAAQNLETWRVAMAAAAQHFAPTHLLAIRGGALVAPSGLPGWSYAPVSGASVLRQMLRARILASREAGLAETQEGLLRAAEANGIELAGYTLSSAAVTQLQSALPAPELSPIGQDLVGTGPLWLRAEPGEDRVQADALAAILVIGMMS